MSSSPIFADDAKRAHRKAMFSIDGMGHEVLFHDSILVEADGTLVEARATNVMVGLHRSSVDTRNVITATSDIPIIIEATALHGHGVFELTIEGYQTARNRFVETSSACDGTTVVMRRPSHAQQYMECAQDGGAELQSKKVAARCADCCLN